MVDHRVHSAPADWLATINGHEPWHVYNESTNTASVFCDTCGWRGRSFRGRWRDRAENQWRIHAGDIAMKTEVVHGELNDRCHCSRCQKRRVAVENGADQ